MRSSAHHYYYLISTFHFIRLNGFDQFDVIAIRYGCKSNHRSKARTYQYNSNFIIIIIDKRQLWIAK